VSRVATARQRSRTLDLLVGAVAAGTGSLVAALVMLRVSAGQLGQLWGSGDAYFYYQAARTMQRHGWVTWNPEMGAPYWMDLAHFPMPEYRSWGLLRLVLLGVSDPIVALNVLFLAGFALVGACAYLLFIRTVRHAPLALCLAVLFATLPWHIHRFTHVLIADYSPVPLMLLLAQLLWTGWWQADARRLGLALAASAYVGLGGLYYAVFGVLVLAPVLVWRLAARPPWRSAAADLAVVLMVPATLGAAVLAYVSTAQAPAVAATYPRSAIDSWVQAGELRSLVLPWPWVPGEPFLEGWAFVSIAAALAVVLLIGLAIPPIRRRVPAMAGLSAEVVPWFRLAAWILLWCAPGLGYLIAVVVSPVVRAWGRLTIVLIAIVLVIAGIVARTTLQHLPRVRVPVLAALVAIMLAQASLDHRALLLPLGTDGRPVAQAYLDDVLEVVPSGCAVLQLPVMDAPEDWSLSRERGMRAYDHMLISTLAPQLQWSFGIIRGTQEWQAAQGRYLGEVSLAGLLAAARDDGFCAVHVDLVGVSPATAVAVTARLGPSVVAEGRWRLHLL
jgi:hypothetical protein